MSLNKRNNKGRLLAFIKFHRWMGLSSVILIFLVSITGIMLNHTEALKLDEQFVKSQWLHNWYGIHLPEQQGFIRFDDSWLVQIGHRVYFDQIRLPDESSALTGGYKMDQMIFISMKKSVYLLTHEGELIEKLSQENGLPIPITHIALSQNKTTVLLNSNAHYYHSEDGYLSWSVVENHDETNAYYPYQMMAANELDMAFYRNAWLGNELSIERVTLDLHSGRLLGRFGVYLMDILALFLIALAVSGLWNWSRRFKRKK